MARQENAIVVQSPFGGLNEVLDARHIGDNELAAASNVVLRGGRVTVRPGFTPARACTFGSTVTTVSNGLTADLDRCYGLYCNSTDNYLVYTLNSAGAGTSEIRYHLYTGLDQQIEDGIGDANLRDMCRIRSVRNAVNDIDLYWWRNTAGARQFYSIQTWQGPGGAPAAASAAVAGAPGVGMTAEPDAPFDIDLDLTRIWYIEQDGAGHRNIAYINCAAGGGGHGTFADLGAGPIVSDLRYYMTPGGNGYLYYTTQTGLYRTRTNAFVQETLSLVPLAARIAIDVTNQKILTWYVAASNLVFRCDLTGANFETFCTDIRMSELTPAGDWESDGYLIVASQNDTMLYKMSTNISTTEIVSSAWIERSRLGVSTDFCRDIMLAQILSSGYSTSHLAAWFPTGDDIYHLLCGYHYWATPTRHVWSINSRDTVHVDGAPLSTKSNRMSFAWQGAGINTGAGGMICADADEDTDSPYCFNYVLGDTIWNVWTTHAGAPAGTFTLTFMGETIIATAWNAVADTVRNNLQALDAIDAVRVTGTGTLADPYIIRLYGAWAGQQTPTLTGVGAGCTCVVAQSQAGGTDTDSWLYLRPCNLPIPVRCPHGATGTIGWETMVHAGAGSVCNGIYNYVVTYYSSRWNIESAPSEVLGDLLGGNPDYINMFVGGGGNYIGIHFNTFPTTLYFDNVAVPFRHIDRLRIYRRRWGAGWLGTVPDGVGATDTWRFVNELDISTGFAAGANIWNDNVSDAECSLNTPAPFENGYPPKNAAFVTIHRDKAYYASQTPGDANIWMSERIKSGGVCNGELGYEYVADNSFQTVEQLAATDCPFTGLYGGFGSYLLIGTPFRALAGMVSQTSSGDEILTIAPIPGTSGIASHWMIAETRNLPDAPGSLFWMSPTGHVYMFDGANCERISKYLKATPDSFVRRYWNDPATFDAGFNNSWYYGTLIVDPDRRLLICQGFKLSDSSGLCQVLSLEASPGWTTWTMNGHGWVAGRGWAAGATQGFSKLLFGTADCKLASLSDGSKDNTANFSWSYSTKKFSAGNVLAFKMWREFVLHFAKRDFSGADPTVTLTPWLDSKSVLSAQTTTLTSDASPTLDIEQASVGVHSRAKHMQLVVSGTQIDLKDHAELIGLQIEFQAPTGMAREP